MVNNSVEQTSTQIQENLVYQQRKEFYRAVYMRDFIEFTIETFSENDLSRNEHLNSLKDVLRHSIESGGTGNEALSRLTALGILEDFPNITENAIGGNTEDSAEICSENTDKINIQLSGQANFPNNEGQETWSSRASNEGGFYFANFVIINPEKFPGRIPDFQELVDSEYSKLKKMRDELRE